MQEIPRNQEFFFLVSLESIPFDRVFAIAPVVQPGDVKVSHYDETGTLVYNQNITSLPILSSADDKTTLICKLSAAETDAAYVEVYFSEQASPRTWSPLKVGFATQLVLVAKQPSLEAVQERTDRLPDQPAAAGDEMNLVDGGITAAKIATNALTASKFGTGAITLRVVADEVIESIAEAVDTELAAELTSIYELVETRLAAADYTAPDNDGIMFAWAVLERLQSMLEVDVLERNRFKTSALANAPTNSGADVYYSEIELVRDQKNKRDVYSVCWIHNAEPKQTVEISGAKIRVEDALGNELIAETAMTAVGDQGQFNLIVTDQEQRIPLGQIVHVMVSATIDGSVRRYARLRGRDSYRS